MPKNQEFAAVLNHLNYNPALAANPGYKDALDAILRVDHTNADAFRGALFAHKAVWVALSGGTLVDGDFVANDATNNNFNAANNNAGEQFVDLYQLAAQKRLELTLSEANEATLATIITQNNQNAVRAQFTNPPFVGLLGNIAQWHGGGFQGNNTTHVTDQAADDIQLEAARVLLIKKIKAAANTPNVGLAIEDLLHANAQANNGNFQAAAARLGIPANVVNLLQAGLIEADSELEKVALRKAFELRVQHHFATDFNPISQVHTALIAVAFNPYGQGIANGVYHQQFQTAEEINWAKGVLGARYLKEGLSLYNNADNLLRIAATANTTTLRTALINTPFDPNNLYVGHAVNDNNAKELRQIAAVQALNLKIAACSDVKALKALADVRDIGSLRVVLDKYPALGFSGADKINARNAFVDSAVLISVLGKAHVRAHLALAPTNYLKDLVAELNFDVNYHQYFVPANESPLVSQALDAYFNNPDNITQSRKEALVALLRANVKNLSDREIADIHGSANNDPAMQAALKIDKLMGVGNTSADNLIDNAFNQILAGLAAAESTLRGVKNADLSNQGHYNGLLDVINNLNRGGGFQALLQAMPPSDQINFRKNLIEILLDKYPLTNPVHAPIVRLSDLVQATDANDVKVKLANMGITTNLDWIDDTVAADLQKKAAARLISTHVAAYSAFPAEVHPHLQAFLIQLSVDKQKAILAKPEVVGSLMKAQSIEEIRRLVGATNSSASALVAENERLNKLNKIANSAIAATLASVVPPITLNNQQINAINTQLLGHVDPKALFSNANYQTFLTNLRDNILQVQPANRAAFNTAFGMNAQGTAIANQPIRQAIKGQQRFNAPLINMVVNNNPQAPTDDEKKAIELLMAIPKTGAYTQQSLAAFVTAINTAPTYNAFMSTITTNPGVINQNLVAGWKKHITPEMFASYKQDQKQRAWSDQVTYAAGIMATEQGEINTLKQSLEKITSIDKYYREELEHLGKLTQTQWISPEFEVAARQQYNTLYPKLKEFARDCDTILEELRRQKAIYEDKLNALPDTSAMAQGQQKKDIDNFRKQLKASLENINNGISYYEKASLTLNGNPSAEDALARKGLIQHLEDCKQGTNVVFTTSGITYNDFPASEKNQHFAKGYVPGAGKQAGTTNTSASTVQDKTYIVDKLQPGMCREYVMTGTKPATDSRGRPTTAADVGTFIEEVHAGHLEPKTVNKKTEVNPKATITVAQFPEDDNNQIKYAMAMAAQLLAHLDHAPTQERPIVLTGSNPEELRHLWTALMVLGKNNPKMKFDHNAIKVNSTAFDPANELGTVYGFNKTALYNAYMKHDTIKQMVATIKTFAESKEAEKGSAKEVTKKIANLLQQFKTEGAKQTLDEIETANKRGRAPGLNG